MKYVAVLVFALFAATAFAQTSASCEAKAVSKEGKPLAGAAKNASIRNIRVKSRPPVKPKRLAKVAKNWRGYQEFLHE